MLDLLVLVLGAFTGIYIRDMQDGFLVRVKYIQYAVGIRAGIEEIADIQCFQVLIAVELLIIGVSDGIKARLVCGQQDWHRIAAKIAAGHGDHMHPIPRDEIIKLLAKNVVVARRNMVEFIHRNQPIIKGRHPELFHCKAESRMGAD